MLRDNQGRALLRLPTTMRLAFAEAYLPACARAGVVAFLEDREDDNLPTIKMVGAGLRSNHGYRKVPAWTVTRRSKEARR
ncbi:MAG: hypothetical protein ACK4TR_08980 [Phenylobacterium sp.]|uniref:hypothetical protein n=1 Tax=Phenylobacterium sp. TaxID=1871053 RepID=UPI00391A80FA